MTYQIHPIPLKMPFNLGLVNAYLIETESNFFLIDTGSTSARGALKNSLIEKGVGKKPLSIVILTHGDFDHTSNAAYLRGIYRLKVGMHIDDWDMATKGDMFANRMKPNFIIKTMMSLLSGFGKSEQFKPDIAFQERQRLGDLGLDGEIIPIPGHSKGSIGVMLSGGEFFCGDLFENTKRPSLNSLMDNVDSARLSLKMLLGENISMVFPGHGEPFSSNHLKAMGGVD